MAKSKQYNKYSTITAYIQFNALTGVLHGMGCSFSSHKVKYADKKSSHNIHVSSCGNMKVNEGQHGERVNDAEG